METLGILHSKKQGGTEIYIDNVLQTELKKYGLDFVKYSYALYQTLGTDTNYRNPYFIFFLNEKFYEVKSSYFIYKYENETWTQMSEQFPEALRGYVTAFKYNNKIYFIKGTTKYYFDGETFVQDADNPVSMTNMAVCEYNGLIYLFGGSTGNRIYTFDGENFELLNIIVPYQINRSVAAELNGKVHIYGGTATGTNFYHYTFDGENFERLSDIPYSDITNFTTGIGTTINKNAEVLDGKIYFMYTGYTYGVGIIRTNGEDEYEKVYGNTIVDRDYLEMTKEDDRIYVLEQANLRLYYLYDEWEETYYD